MKYIFYLLILLFPIFGFSQIEDPVSWSFDVEDLGDGEYRLNVNAEIEAGWHIYSQYKDPESFVIATAFYFEDIKDIDFEDVSTERVDYPLDGYRVFFKESVPIEKYVPIQEGFAKYFEDFSEFTALIKVNSSVQYIKATGEFMVCNDQECLPPSFFDIEFCLYGDCSLKKKDNTIDYDNSTIQSLVDNKKSNRYKRNISDSYSSDNIKDNTEDDSLFLKLLQALFAGMIGGLIALITPCVFPMIPLTVSYFLKGSEKRRKAIFNACLYGFFIVFIYFLLSVPFHFFDINSDILYKISTNPVLNFIFFIVFVVFAISFFGYFEIRIPSKWVNKVDSASNIGGFIGIFFMALTLALVSFSCTGPVLGTALAKTGLSASGEAVDWQLSFSMIGFGLTLGIPFALFALFPNWLKSLPKSGGWMNTLKVVIGFIEIALAIKFLANADGVNITKSLFGTGIWIKYETVFVLWAITFFGLALYLIGGIYFPHEKKNQKIGIGRIIFATISMVVVIYLIPGTTCSIKSPSYSLFGLAPAKNYSKCPPSPKGYHTYDYFEALDMSLEYKMPILVDFTGNSCQNCRKLEAGIWENDSIKDLMENDYIVASLYVDWRDDYPIEIINLFNEKGDSIGSKKIQTIGDRWLTLQQQTFMKNTQPLHVILMPCADVSNEDNCDEKLLGLPLAYIDANDEGFYKNWLKEGLRKYKEFSK